MKTNWIPVEGDEKPQEDTFVLAYHPDWAPKVTRYYNGEFEKIGASPVTPTHWMRIPAVPAEADLPKFWNFGNLRCVINDVMLEK